ncbi:glycosyltransferase [Claveliimonas bilis]|uniref:glycosyltransferase n=1 Tax=Claveliimonas bilis TaxID=3028070 RepID=UPI00292DFB4C|nr:glycosyltransferase [Claveliimonas bilis]BDZ80927.1 glycosyl transferase family 1 [Claveliimonas bilis]
MKVLHVLQSDRFSGAENVVCQIISLLKEHIDFAYCSRDGQIREALNERDIRFKPIKSMTISELKRVIKEEKPDIIHAHDISASVLSSVTAGKIPVISHVHVNNSNMARVNFKTLLYLGSSIKYKHIFWVSSSCFKSFVFNKYVKSKSSILFNVMDESGIIKRSEKDHNQYSYDIVYIGRLSYQKNPERMLKLFNSIIIQEPAVKIGIVGTGEYLDKCKRYIREKGIDDNVKFLGFMENPLKVLKDAKVMVMTSRYEGTPMTALEAMALGIPIVSTPTDGMLELIENGTNGYLSDSDEELKSYLLKVVRDSEKRKRMSQNTIKKFRSIMNPEKYKDELLKMYKQIM